MQSLTIDRQGIHAIDWEEECFKYCEFVGISPQGKHITADFTACIFKGIDGYWGIFNSVNFIGCTFIDCAFRGTAFPDCRFVECELQGCRFTRDHLDGECRFDGSVAYNCTLTDCAGFGAEIK